MPHAGSLSAGCLRSAVPSAAPESSPAACSPPVPKEGSEVERGKRKAKGTHAEKWCKIMAMVGIEPGTSKTPCGMLTDWTIPKC